jgi:hypothetical protein
LTDERRLPAPPATSITDSAEDSTGGGDVPRHLVLTALDAFEAGDQWLGVEVLRNALEDGPIVNDTRCKVCRRWPGKQWTCANVRRDCAQLADAA